VIHTPYDGSSRPFTIGLKPLDLATWIDVDDQFDLYVAEKRRLYREETANVLVAEQGTEAAQQEVLEMVVEHLAKYYPRIDQHTNDSRFRSLPNNRHPGEGRDPASLQASAFVVKLDPGLRRDDGLLGCALAEAGLLIQEDLVLMRASPQGWRLVAASVCFPSAWNLREKFGRPMRDIHAPVPGFNAGTRNAGLIDRMFDKLHPAQPVIRWNWSLYGDDRLYHPASDNQMKKRFGEGPMTGRVVMRFERQTLRKLPTSGDILFTIRIYTDPLEVLANHADGKALASSMLDQIAGFTDEEVAYKGLVGEKERLLARIKEFT
jgi:dimethylamine monooxygenase subunit A